MTPTDGRNRRYLLASRPEGRPDESNFELTESAVPTPGEGELLVRVAYLSMDPYLRDLMRESVSYAETWDVGDPLETAAVGEVVESNHPDVEAGAFVKATMEWADYDVVDGGDAEVVDPDLAPVSTALGVLGMNGRTAYFGMLSVGDPEAGETVVVSAAAGAVGSIAAQIAGIEGCRVVGIAGSDRKTAYLTDELGLDAAINYRTGDLEAALGEACPDGVDVYFDNVGGEISDAVLARINEHARIPISGQIALYNAEGTPTGPRAAPILANRAARMEGFLVWDFEDRYPEADRRLAEWIDSGAIRYRQTVTEGLEHAPEAFVGLFEGANLGKQLVRVTG